MVLITPLRIIIYTGVVLSSYALVDRWLSTHTRRITVRLQASRRHSLSEVDSVIRLLLWTLILMCLLCPAALVILAVRPSQVLMATLNPLLLLYGILIGLGGAGLGEFLCYIIIRTIPALARGDSTSMHYHTQPSGKWSSSFPCTLGVVPFPFMLALMLLFATLEETMLRAVVIAAVAQLGPMVALGCAIALSLLTQLFPRTSWRLMLFSFIGTLVAALVHGTLFLAVPDVRPLIIAQFMWLIRTAI
jgi:hypothetical protein